MAVKTFKVAAKNSVKRDDLEFKLEGDDTSLYLRGDVKPESLAMIAVEMADENESVSSRAVVKMLNRIFTRDTMLVLRDRVEVKQDLTWDEVVPVMHWFYEELSGRPTEPSSD